MALGAFVYSNTHATPATSGDPSVTSRSVGRWRVYVDTYTSVVIHLHDICIVCMVTVHTLANARPLAIRLHYSPPFPLQSPEPNSTTANHG
jgi:hypothetical protein